MADTGPETSSHAEWEREAYLIDALAQLEKLATDSTKARSWGAAERAKGRAIAVRAELDQLRETRTRAAEPPPSPEEHRAEILREIRRMRIGAQAAGSWVAAEKLLVEEQQMLIALEEERRRAEADRLGAADPEEIVGELVELIGRLPEQLLDRVREAVARRGA